MGTGARRRGLTKQPFERKEVREKALQTLSEGRVVLVQETAQRPQDKSILVAVQGTMGKWCAFFRDKRDRGQGRICGHDSREKYERKMNGYAKTRSMLSHLPLQVIQYLYTFLNTCLLLNKKKKKKKKPNCRKAQEGKSLARLAQGKFRNCVTSW